MFQSQRTPANALILSLMFMTSACQSADPEVAPPAGDPPGKNASGPAIEISEKSFKCIRDMKQVRGFFVDNLTGDIDGTLAVANSSTGGVYPPGSVVQLVPYEAMVKREKGYNPVTRDWEFFELDVAEEGTTIRKRGFQDVKNRFDGNCFACHVMAKPQWDLICEKDHGCEALPISETALLSLQNTDPRCEEKADLPFRQRVTAWFIKTFTSF